MSGAKLGNNAAKVPFGCNNDRPGGASLLATSLDPNELQFAVENGNRQTRRLALQKLARMRCPGTQHSRSGQIGSAP